MDQGTRVGIQIEDGQRLIDRLADEGFAVTAAGWVKESDGGLWFLYLATPLVSADGATRAAYRRLIDLMLPMRQEGFGVDPMEVKLIGPDEPIAKAMQAVRDRSRGRRPIWFRGNRLGELEIEEAYIYP